MKIVFCIRSLARAGAERQLVTLANGLALRGHDVCVVVLSSGGGLEGELENVKVVHFEKRGRWDFSFLPKLISYLRSSDPDVVHGYLGLGNILAVLCKPFLGNASIVWGVRASYVDLRRYDSGARLSFRAECFFSRFANAIIANSYAGKEYAISVGYPAELMHVVPNGIDAEAYAPAKALGASIRRSMQLDCEDVLFGLVGRVDVMKGHDVFLHAASKVASRLPHVHFVFVGKSDGKYGEDMKQLGESLPGLVGRVHWLPPREDLLPVYGAIDVLVSASRFGEGFSNVVGEAMACGVPCLVTDVGDCSYIVGDTGVVIPPEDPDTLTGGMETMLDRVENTDWGLQARARIEEKFNVENLVSLTESILESLRGS